MNSPETFSSADECPRCGNVSYQGGHCFHCGVYRRSQHADPTEEAALDTVDFMSRSYGTRLGESAFGEDEED